MSEKAASSAKKRIEVVAGAILRQDLVLVARRSAGALAGFWEFPGGKIEPDENPEQALCRELREELGIEELEILEHLTTDAHEYPLVVVNLHVYLCRLDAGVGGPVCSTDHDRLEWVSSGRLSDYLWAPADLPAVRALQAYFK